MTTNKVSPTSAGRANSGADIAALDVALRHDFPHGGWCPKGRRSLDGPIPVKYQLRETPFTLGAEATGGSLKTIGFAKKHRKPCLHIPRDSGCYKDPALILQRFVEEHGIRVLNVAGSRESKEPGIHDWVMEVLEEAIFWAENHPGILGGPGVG